MKREGYDSVNFFTGIEVERTPAYGQKTLFVVGLQPVDSITEKMLGHQHIFFGANHSFHPASPNEWDQWESMIVHFLNLGYLCSLDIPITHVEDFNDGELNEHDNFIPQIRVSVPYIKLWNYNTMIKIDDNDFNATNPGVWCHSLHSLMSRENFTSWNQYTKDQPL